MVYFVTSKSRFCVFVFLALFQCSLTYNIYDTKMVQDNRKIIADLRSGHLITPYSKIKILHRRGPLSNDSQDKARGSEKIHKLPRSHHFNELPNNMREEAD